jgi:hypothetical protein
MKNRLLPSKQNVLINKIFFTEEFYNEFKKRLFLALQKYQSSRKTKIVHHLIENDNIEMVLFTGGDDDTLIGKIAYSENKLYTIYLNSLFFADYAGNEIVTIFSKIIDTITKLENEEKVITDQRIYNINKLKAEYNEWMQKFLDAFDYIKIIDGIYYMFLEFLFYRIYTSNITVTKKLLLLNSQYLSSFIQYIYRKTTKMSVDDALKEKINVISDFFILVYYYGDSVSIALKKIEKAYGKEAAEFLRKSNHLKCEHFDNLADILFETDTFKIQKNIFEMFFKKEFGELGYKLIKKNKTAADAFICSINHKNVLFNAIPINEKLSFQIEELILNEKAKIIITKQIKKFL